MVKNTPRVQKGESALSRERVIDAAIELLDAGGETGLTFKALAARLATGAGAIYWHVDNKDDLLSAAADRVMAGALDDEAAASPREGIRQIALSLFNLLEAHPWVGSELTRAAWKMPMVRIVEALGRHVVALPLQRDAHHPATFILLNYIIGVARQNAANAQLARQEGLVRDAFLGDIARTWSDLDPQRFPFVRSITDHLKSHDDREEFLAGIDLIVRGLEAASGRA